MKKILLIFLVGFCLNCNGQKPLIKDLSNEKEMNYVFALIDSKSIITKELYNQTLFATVYKIYDPLVTPDDFNPTDGHDVLDSYIISVKSSDTYVNSENSKLFKISGVYDSKILEIKESKYPNIIIKIEYKESSKRKIKSFKFKGSY